MQLRPYQAEALELMQKQTDGKHILELATGAGKTFIFTEFCRRNENKKILILAHRKFLIEQIASYNIKNVTLATWQSYIGKSETLIDPDVVIVDEGHRIGEHTIYNNFIKDKKLVFAFTATPFRFMQDFSVLYRVDTEQLINGGYLTPFKFFVPDSNLKLKQNSIITTQIVEAINKFHNKKTIVFTNSIKSANLLYKALGERRATVWHSKAKNVDFSKDIIINVNIAIEGFDEPSIDTVILAKRTESAINYVQMVGRGLRLFKDKKACNVVDLGNNIGHFGLPSKPKYEKTKENKQDAKPSDWWVCDDCFIVNEFKIKQCGCGFLRANSRDYQAILKKIKLQEYFTQKDLIVESFELVNDKNNIKTFLLNGEHKIVLDFRDKGFMKNYILQHNKKILQSVKKGVMVDLRRKNNFLYIKAIL